MPEVLILNDGNFTKEVKLSEKPVVLVEFSAEWAEECKGMDIILEEIALEFDYVKVCKIDVDASPKITARYRVVSAPTFLVFHNAQIVNQEIGALTKDDLRNMVM